MAKDPTRELQNASEWDTKCSACLQGSCHLQITTKRINQLHLARCSTFRPEQARTRNYNAEALRARRGHIQTIGAIQKLHSPRSVGVGRGRHRIDHYRRLLALKLVNCPDPPARYPFLKFENLSVV